MPSGPVPNGGNVVGLRGELPTVNAEANQGCIDILRDALARAERGEIDHVAVAYTDKDGAPGGTYDGKPSFVIYAMSRLSRRVHAWVDHKEAERA